MNGMLVLVEQSGAASGWAACSTTTTTVPRREDLAVAPKRRRRTYIYPTRPRLGQTSLSHWMTRSEGDSPHGSLPSLNPRNRPRELTFEFSVHTRYLGNAAGW